MVVDCTRVLVMEVVRNCYLLEIELTGFALVLSLRWTPPPLLVKNRLAIF